MIKKLHKDLLENYPLIWNLRLLSILGVCAGLHLFHFLAGYLSFTSVTGGWNSPEGVFFDTPLGMFSIISSFIIFILWLIRVFRNNPFKSFYPLSNLQLYGQLMAFMLVSFLNITYYFSFTYGYVAHAKMSTNYISNKKDAAIFNSVTPYLQESKEVYAIENKCSPAPFPMIKKYRANDDNTSAVSAENEQENNVYYVGSDGQEYTPRQLDSLGGGYEYSYLNYCGGVYFEHGVTPVYEMGNPSEARNRSVGKIDPKELKENMVAFLKLCDKYKVGYKIDVDEWFKWVYNPPYFPVNYTLRNQYYNPYAGTSYDSDYELAEERSQVNPKGFYVRKDQLQYIIDNTFRVHEYQTDFGVLCILLYLSLAFAMMIFTFRVTSKRVWLITLVGSALISMLLGAATAVIGLGHSSDGVSIVVFYLLVIFSFLLIYFTVQKKSISGAALNWFAWSSSMILPLIVLAITINNDNNSESSDFEMWFNRNEFLFSFICFIVYLAILAALTPLYRRWQALAED